MAAEASECAADQDAFWEYHDTLFENLGGENRGSFSEENLIGFADSIGLDTETFSECLTTDKYAQVVQTDTSAAQQIGVQSTPTFLVNGQPIVGAQSFEVFEQVIEQKLSE